MLRVFLNRFYRVVPVLLFLFCWTSSSAVTQQGDPGVVRFFFRQGPTFDSYIDNATPAQKQAMNQDFWQSEEFHPTFDAMTSWYPNALDYMDCLAIYADNNPNMSWVIRDVNDQPLFLNFGCNVSEKTCPQYAADITNTSPSGFRAWWIAQAQQLPALGYRGLWIDDVNLYKNTSQINLVHADGTHGIPVDSNTHQPLTQDQWNAYMAAWMTQIRNAMPSSEILQNTLWYAGDTSPGTDPNVVTQIKASDLINIEGGICDSGLTGGSGFWSLSNWFNYIDQVHSLGKGVVLANNSKCATAQQEYTLAGYFMISNGSDATGFPNEVPITNWWPGFNVSLGAPLGARYHRNGISTIWERDYANGIVILNEPSAATVNIALPNAYLRIDGSTVTSLSLTARQGAVLMNTTSVALPTITLDTNALSFTNLSNDANPPDQSLTLSNTGAPNTTLVWTVTSNQPWLTLSSTSGSLSSGSSSPLSVSINTNTLSIGSYSGTLTFTSTDASNSPQTVQISIAVVSSSIGDIRVYPNPWRSDGVATEVTFDRLTPGSTVHLFTLSGQAVKKISADGTAEVTWDLTNDHGQAVASGLYVYVVIDAQGNKSRGKLTIIR